MLAVDYLTPLCNLPTNAVTVPPPRGGGGRSQSDGSPLGGGEIV